MGFPHTAEEKNQIAEGLQLTALLPFPLNFLVLPAVGGLIAELTRPSFPPIQIGPAIQELVRLQNLPIPIQGLTSTDPFFGDLVISREDQAPFLTELLRTRAIQRISAEQDSSRQFLQRRLLIEGLEETGAERGFAAGIDPSLRGGVFRPTADAPLQFIPGDFI